MAASIFAANSHSMTFVERWVALPGIGEWTAHYMAMRALSHPDAFPAADLILRRAAAGDAPELSTKALTALAEAWRPWRAYAVMHLWRSASDAANAVPQQSERADATERAHLVRRIPSPVGIAAARRRRARPARDLVRKRPSPESAATALAARGRTLRTGSRDNWRNISPATASSSTCRCIREVRRSS